MEEKGFKDFVSKVGKSKPATPGAAPKAWQGSHEEIINLWRNTQPLEIHMEPVPASYKGRRYSADGIRLTGRGEFINSVLARLKDLLKYDAGGATSLDVDYRELAGRSNKIGALKRQPRYVAYIYTSEEKPNEPKK